MSLLVRSADSGSEGSSDGNEDNSQQVCLEHHFFGAYWNTVTSHSCSGELRLKHL